MADDGGMVSMKMGSLAVAVSFMVLASTILLAGPASLLLMPSADVWFGSTAWVVCPLMYFMLVACMGLFFPLRVEVRPSDLAIVFPFRTIHLPLADIVRLRVVGLEVFPPFLASLLRNWGYTRMGVRWTKDHGLVDLCYATWSSRFVVIEHVRGWPLVIGVKEADRLAGAVKTRLRDREPPPEGPRRRWSIDRWWLLPYVSLGLLFFVFLFVFVLGG
jgi:hypothetical protein